MDAIDPDHMMIPPDGMPPVAAKAFNWDVVASSPSSLLISDVDAVTPSSLLSSDCVAVIAPVTFGNVDLMVAFSNRKWSSACAKPSVEAGFEAFNELIYVPDSSAISGVPYCVSVGGSCVKGRTTTTTRTALVLFFEIVVLFRVRGV